MGHPLETETHRGRSQGLNDSERAMLDLEGRHFKYVGAKQEAIRTTLHMSGTRYYQLLNRLIDAEAALAYAPMTVKRLREARTGRLETPR